MRFRVAELLGRSLFTSFCAPINRNFLQVSPIFDIKTDGKRSIGRSIHHRLLHYPIRQQFCYDGSGGCNRSRRLRGGGRGGRGGEEEEDKEGEEILLFSMIDTCTDEAALDSNNCSYHFNWRGRLSFNYDILLKQTASWSFSMDYQMTLIDCIRALWCSLIDKWQATARNSFNCCRLSKMIGKLSIQTELNNTKMSKLPSLLRLATTVQLNCDVLIQRSRFVSVR